MGAQVEVYIAVGSNVAPERNILRALELLEQVGLPVEATSTFYRTQPIDRPGQPWYRNGLWRVKTDIPLRRLQFDVLRGVESKLGRIRTDDAYAPRPLDLDVIIYGETVSCEPDLVVPDPDIYRRPFLAGPLMELEPALNLPGSGHSLRDLEIIAQVADLEPDHELTAAIKNRIGG